MLDLGPYFRRAYKRRETVKLFEQVNPKTERLKQEARAEVRRRGCRRCRRTAAYVSHDLFGIRCREAWAAMTRVLEVCEGASLMCRLSAYCLEFCRTAVTTSVAYGSNLKRDMHKLVLVRVGDLGR